MACSICRASNHNSRTCPNKKDKEIETDYTLWVKFDCISKKQATDLLKDIIESKDSIAPNARGTFAKADKKDLSIEIKKALKLLDDDNDKN